MYKSRLYAKSELINAHLLLVAVSITVAVVQLSTGLLVDLLIQRHPLRETAARLLVHFHALNVQVCSSYPHSEPAHDSVVEEVVFVNA